MEPEGEAAVIDKHREALRVLSRRELQARAKALGVRANGKSVDIVESVAKVLSRPGTPVKCASAVEQEELENEYGAASIPGDLPRGGCASTPLVMERFDSVPRVVQSPPLTTLRASPKATTGLDQPAGSHLVPPTAPTTVGSASTSDDAHVASVTTPGPGTPGPGTAALLAEMAARASAAALAASLSNLRVETELRISALGLMPASLRRQQAPWVGLHSSSRASPCSAKQDDSPDVSSPGEYVQPLADGDQQGMDATQLAVAGGQGMGEEAARRLPFTFSPLPRSKSSSSLGAALFSAGRQLKGSGQPPEETLRAACGAPSMPEGVGGALASAPSAAASSPGQVASAPPLESAAALCPAGTSALTPTATRLGAIPARPTEALVTDRTPLRQQRFLGAQLQPPGGAPAGRGAAVPRTPGAALRTPARRVPVCTDEAKERALDEWVMKHLVRMAGSPVASAGLSLGQLVGLHDLKHRLQVICGSNGASSTEATSPSVAAPPRAAGAALSSSIGRASKAAAGSPTTAPSRGAKPCSLPNAAVLVIGPRGAGKALLARAFAEELHIPYIRVPPDLATRVAHEPGGAEVVIRSVARVAVQLPGPVVVHVEDVERLAGVDAVKQSLDCRRLRTELLVAVDELLLQPPAQTASPGVNGPAAASCVRSASPAHSPVFGMQAGVGESSSSSRSQFKVLVLTTTSRPMDLDAPLAASLGRTDVVFAAPPGPEDRELYLVSRLAAEGAALGLQEVERLVRQTEGLSVAQLAALCDAAVDAAAARQGSSAAPGVASLNEGDIGLALQHVTPGAEEMCELRQWQLRVGAMQNRRV